jgi:tetratricopeptide (TPR) repeat protein
MSSPIPGDPLPHSTDSPAALAAWDALLGAYARFGTHLPVALADLFVVAPELPMAHCARGYLMLLGGKRELVAHAQAASDWLRAAPMLTPWESLHGDALRYWLRGDATAAAATWETILDTWPGDFLALRLAQFAHFYAGDAQRMRDCTDRAAVLWDPTSPLHGFVLGAQAFGHEECGDYARAEALGREAVQRNPDDAWAVHAVAHCMEMQGRAGEGVAWLDAWFSDGRTCNLQNHLRWHRALMQIELGNGAAALADYDAGQYGSGIEYLDVCNDTSLLLRLELAGLNPLDSTAATARWSELAARAHVRADDGLMSFCDMHYVLALGAAGDGEAVAALLQRLQARSWSGSSDGKVLATIGVALASALAAWRTGQPDITVDRLWEQRREIVRIGGSHAQRELFELVLMDAARRSGRTVELRSMLAERLGRQPGSARRQQALAAHLQAQGPATTH